MDPSRDRKLVDHVSELSDAIYRGLTKGRSPQSEGFSVRWRVAELERAYGGPRAAATIVGVSYRTWQRWRSGAGLPSPVNAVRLGDLIRRARLRPGRERRLRQADPPMILFRGEVWYSSTREREIDLGPHVHEGAVGELIDAYLSRDDAGMDELFRALMHEYVQGMEIVRTDSIVFGV